MTHLTSYRPRPGAPLCRAAAVGLCVLLASCISPPKGPLTPDTRIAKRGAQSTGPTAGTGSARERLTSSEGPAPSLGKTTTETIPTSQPPPLQGEPISVNFEGVRLPAAINTIFGDLLKVTFEIDSAVMKRDVLVTLRTAEALPRNQFYRLVTEVLSNYGVAVVYSNNVYRIIEAANAKQAIPHIVRSRAVTSIPGDMRPVFYFTPVSNIGVGNMITWLDLTFRDRVRPVSIPNANGLLLLGNAEDINAAVETIQALDQPFMAGYQSLKISPAFWSAPKLAQQLVDVLSAEGYSIGIGAGQPFAIKLIPVEALNVIVAFGTSQEALRHTLQWATDLDQPSQTISAQGVFYHQVYNAKAKDLAEVVKALLESSGPSPAGAQDQKGPAVSARQRVTVDEARNALIFQGTAEEYAQFRTLMTQMDRAPLAVLIEATVAEVTLGRDQNLGTTFGYDDTVVGANTSNVTVGAGGLQATVIRNMGNMNVKLNALASDKKVQILSTPRLVTNSGKTATINVGTQVPIITEQQQAPGGTTVGGTSTLLQSVQYRNTGVILTIQPTINSSRRVEITLQQEVSQAQANATSAISSPAILQRAISTTLSLDDGETVLLGGLITQNFSDNESGIPFLKDIPGLGYLFNNKSRGMDRTELIVLLTPYIIDSPETARQVRDAFRSQLGEWARTPGPAQAAPPAAN
jgi:general secretion pathway protein D